MARELLTCVQQTTQKLGASQSNLLALVVLWVAQTQPGRCCLGVRPVVVRWWPGEVSQRLTWADIQGASLITCWHLSWYDSSNWEPDSWSSSSLSECLSVCLSLPPNVGNMSWFRIFDGTFLCWQNIPKDQSNGCKCYLEKWLPHSIVPAGQPGSVWERTA